VYAKDLCVNLAFIVIGFVVFSTVYRQSNDPIPTDRATASDLPAKSDVHAVDSRSAHVVFSRH